MPGDVRTDGLAGPHPHGLEVLYKFEKIATIAVAGLALYLAATETLGWVPFAVGALVAAVMLFVRWPYGAVLELLIAASIPRWTIPIGSWNAKPEHFVAAACGLTLIVRTFTQNHRWKPFGKLEFLLLAFLAMNFFSSAVTSPDTSSTLRWSLLLTLAVSPFFLVWQVVSTHEQLDKIMVFWLWVGMLGASFGILCFLSHLLFQTVFGVTFFSYLSFIPGVHGSLWEPNIFGSYCTCFAVMFLFYFLAGARKNGLYLTGFLITTLGGMLSLARQAWICLVVVGVLVLFYSLRRSKIKLKRLAPVLVTVSIALVVGLTVMQDLSDKMATLAVDKVGEDPTVLRRAGLIALAMGDIQDHPLLGLGTSSFQLLYIAEDDSHQGVDKAWLGSLFFGVIHDTGLIGMTLFLWLLVELGRRAWRVLAAPVRAPGSTAVGALLAGALVMLIAYQFTDASTLAFTWIQFGLLAAALRIAHRPLRGTSW